MERKMTPVLLNTFFATIIAIGKWMSESAEKMMVTGTEMAALYPEWQVVYDDHHQEKKTVFQMVTIILSQITPIYVGKKNDHILAFFLSIITIMMGAILQKSHQTVNYLIAFHEYMAILGRNAVLNVISVPITVLILDLGVFNHLVTFIREADLDKVYREFALFTSLCFVETLLRCCTFMNALVVSRALQELSKSTLLTVVIKNLLVLQMRLRTMATPAVMA
jgi:hypothetical protein